MISGEMDTYWIPAARNLGLNYWSELDNALGVDEYRVGRPFSHEPLPQDLKKLLVMLAGPHGKTILKAYRIQKGLEK